jgi:CheY-like chemotaxis protein
MSRPADLLIVDDNPAHEYLTRVLMGELGFSHRCHYVSNGNSALDFLYRRPPFELAPRPRLIMLDLNMPGLSGCEVLHQIKTDCALRSIPVIILSTSEHPDDIESCYTEHANAYVHKPQDLEGNIRLLREIDSFWLGTVRLP